MSRDEKRRFKRTHGCSPFVWYAKWTIVFGFLIGCILYPYIMWAINEFNKI